MFLQPYLPHEIQFAYCYRIFLRLRTQHVQMYEPLSLLERADLRTLLTPYNIRVLELASNSTDLLTTLSLRPQETISAATSKVKGRVSKWLREALELTEPQNLLSKGYFACTIGKSRQRSVESYLSRQSDHHGYANRDLPPVYVRQFAMTEEDLSRVSPRHGVAIAQFHIVLATTGRQGVLGSNEAELLQMHGSSCYHNAR